LAALQFSPAQRDDSLTGPDEPSNAKRRLDTSIPLHPQPQPAVRRWRDGPVSLCQHQTTTLAIGELIAAD
jgi:hypothetical protein